MPSDRVRLTFRPGPLFILLAAFLAVVLIAGGASRGDVWGQVIVRCAALIAIVAGILAIPRRPALDAVVILLLAAGALTLVQLIPLPPGFWMMLPARDPFVQAVPEGLAQPWRPWSLVPGATANAAASLIVPFATWLLVTALPEAERKWLPGLVLALISTSMLIGLIQFSGSAIDNPLINDTPGEVAGTFANRNHFALLLAMGCLIAPIWAFTARRRATWRLLLAAGLVLLFLLTILASGSRAGLGLGLVALLLGLILSGQAMRDALRHYPRWTLPVLVAVIAGVIAAFVLTSFVSQRAVSIDRIFATDPGQDMRGRGFPTVLSMAAEYFPLGAGVGTFDPVFRIHEPHALLKPTFFNQAHNDFLDIAVSAGIPGLMLLTAALGWWIASSIRVWRGRAGERKALPRLGSAILFLVILASIVDYPGRTPLIMAMMVIAALWLRSYAQDPQGSALPQSRQ